jgi:RNA polymerase sigma-70 factor (ECF subfamily)
MSDAELVRQAKAGRTEAYAELVRRWAGRVTALCHARVGNAHLADDLAQETLLRGFRALASLSDPERFGAWLCGIALRICLDHCKSPKNKQVPFSALDDQHQPDNFVVSSAESSLAILEREEERQLLLAQIERLPTDYRQVLMLFYYQDITYREIAELLGVSVPTVNARLTRARALLRARLNLCPR